MGYASNYRARRKIAGGPLSKAEILRVVSIAPELHINMDVLLNILSSDLAIPRQRSFSIIAQIQSTTDLITRKNIINQAIFEHFMIPYNRNIVIHGHPNAPIVPYSLYQTVGRK